MVTDASPWCQGVWRARGVTVARVEVTTDEHRCGIDPCSPALQRNADPHPAMDRPRVPGTAFGCACCRISVRVSAPASLRTTFLLPPCFHGDEFVEATFRINRAKSSKFNGLLARPKRFELLTPRFVVWCSIQLSYGRVLRIAREVFPNRANPAGTDL